MALVNRTNHTNHTNHTKIFLSGVGGQGSITATVIIGEAALAAGLNVVTSELHGMAQRGGIVTSTVVVGEACAPTIPDGTADILLSFEPVEALRSVTKMGPQTVAIVSTRPIVPVSVSLGKQAYPSLADIEQRLTEVCQRVLLLDATALAAEAGTPKAMGAVLLGALAGLERLPIPTDTWLEALTARAPSKFREANVQAFTRGFQRAQDALLSK